VNHLALVRIWPRPKWRQLSLTFQLSEVHHNFPLKSILFPTSSRSSPLRSEDSSVPKTSAPATNHPRSPPTVTTSYLLPRYVWRHSARTVMNSDGFSCIQSLQASTTDHGCYNKSTCVNRAVTKISLAPTTTMPTAQPNINKPHPLTKKKDSTLYSKGTQFWSSILILFQTTHLLDSYTPCSLIIIVKLLLPVVFSRLRVST